jgi:hypothetical protein
MPFCKKLQIVNQSAAFAWTERERYFEVMFM